MNPLFLYAWSASTLYGLEAILEKLISKHSISNPWLLNFLYQTFILFGVMGVSLYFGAGIPQVWSNLFFASIFYALGGFLYIKALYLLDVSVFIPLFSFRTVLTMILGVFLLGEILSLEQIILILAIFALGMFVSFDEKMHIRSFFNRKILIAMLDMIALAFLAFFIKKAVGDVGFWDATMWIALLGQFWLLFTIPLFKRDIVNLRPRQYGAVGLVAVIGVAGDIAANAAYSKNISIASAIIALPISMILAFIVSCVAPEILEKHTLKVYAIRFLAAAGMIFAALQL